MATSVGELVVDLKAEIAQFSSNLAKADSALRASTARMDKHLADLRASFRMVGLAAAGFGVSLSIASLVRYGKQALDAAGGIGELAEQLGISTDALQSYQVAALASGVKNEQLETGISALTRKIGEAAGGTDEAVRAFNALGVGVLDAAGNVRSTEAILGDVADALALIDNPARRATAAAEIFGTKVGQRLLPMLSGGRAGLESFSAHLSGDMVNAADRASDAINRVTDQWARYFQLIAANAAPTAERIALSLMPTNALTDAELNRQILKDEAWLRDQPRSTRTLPTQRRLEDMRLELAQRDARRWALGGGDFGMVAPPRAENPMPQSEIDRINREYDAIGKVITALRDEEEQLRLHGVALAEHVALRKAGITETHAMAEAVKEQARETLAAQQAKAREADDLARLAKAYQDIEDATDASNRAAREMQIERAKIGAEIEREIAGNERLIAALRKGGDAYERVRAELEILNKLKAENGTLTDAETRRAKELATAIGTQEAEIKRLKDANDEAARAQRDLYHAIGTAAEDAILRAKSLKDVLRGLIEDIERIILRKFVTKPLEGAIDKIDFGSIFGDILGGTGSSTGQLPGEFPGMDIFSGWFAAGTASAPPGLAIVGEAGPELVAFHGGERVFDAGETAGMLGGRGPTVFIDARGSDREGYRKLERLIAQLYGDIRPMSVAAVADAMSRGQLQFLR